jgi:hypothetical protein
LRRLLIVTALGGGLLVIIRLLLDPVATHLTRKALNDVEGMRADLEGVAVSVLPPGYRVDRLKIVEHPPDDWKRPLFYAERVSVTLDWRALLKARLAARARLDQPKVIYTNRKDIELVIPDVSAALARVLPARIDRVEVREGEVVYRDLTAPRHPQIWVHDIELALENLATRPNLAGGRPLTMSGKGRLGRSGDVTAFVSADPHARKLEFAGQLGVKGWKVRELFDLIEPATGLQTPKGTLDVFAEFKAARGVITGGVKPVLKGVEVRPTDGDFGTRLKAWLADTGLELFSDRVPDRNAVVTVIPIKGKLEAPDVQLWPTVLGVIRNAFVEGISSGFAHLPPRTAARPQGKIEQIERALDEDEGPPDAQPAPGPKDKT